MERDSCPRRPRTKKDESNLLIRKRREFVISSSSLGARFADVPLTFRDRKANYETHNTRRNNKVSFQENFVGLEREKEIRSQSDYFERFFAPFAYSFLLNLSQDALRCNVQSDCSL